MSPILVVSTKKVANDLHLKVMHSVEEGKTLQIVTDSPTVIMGDSRIARVIVNQCGDEQPLLLQGLEGVTIINPTNASQPLTTPATFEEVIRSKSKVDQQNGTINGGASKVSITTVEPRQQQPEEGGDANDGGAVQQQEGSTNEITGISLLNELMK